jgi:hypothetical protein
MELGSAIVLQKVPCLSSTHITAIRAPTKADALLYWEVAGTTTKRDWLGYYLAHLKTGRRASVSRVRIPPHPPVTIPVRPATPRLDPTFTCKSSHLGLALHPVHPNIKVCNPALGTTQTFSSRLTSLHCAPMVSDVRAAVRMVNASAFAAA